jgi:hypothetical protein
MTPAATTANTIHAAIDTIEAVGDCVLGEAAGAGSAEVARLAMEGIGVTPKLGGSVPGAGVGAGDPRGVGVGAVALTTTVPVMRGWIEQW